MPPFTILALARSALVGSGAGKLHLGERALWEAFGWRDPTATREARLTTLAAAAAMLSVRLVRVLEPGELPGDVDMRVGEVDVSRSFAAFIPSTGGLGGRLVAVERWVAQHQQDAQQLVLVDADLSRERARAFIRRRFRAFAEVTLIAPTRAAAMLEGDLVTLADAVGLRGHPQDVVERIGDERPF